MRKATSRHSKITKMLTSGLIFAFYTLFATLLFGVNLRHKKFYKLYNKIPLVKGHLPVN